jgi:hypothetical protein
MAGKHEQQQQQQRKLCSGTDAAAVTTTAAIGSINQAAAQLFRNKLAAAIITMQLLLVCCCCWCLLWQGALSELLSGGDFEAKQGSASRALRLGKPAGAASGPRYVALLGLGKAQALAQPAGERYGANPYQVGQ